MEWKAPLCTPVCTMYLHTPVHTAIINFPGHVCTLATQCTRVHTSVKQRTGVHTSVCTRVHAWAQVCTGGHTHVCTLASYTYKQPCTPAHTLVNTRARLFERCAHLCGCARLCECGVHACATSATPVHACFRGVHACPDTFPHVCTAILHFRSKRARVWILEACTVIWDRPVQHRACGTVGI